MNYIKYQISPEYKKSFVSYDIYEECHEEPLVVTKEEVWRRGTIGVTLYDSDFEKISKESGHDINVLKNDPNKLFNIIKNGDKLVFDDEFPYEWEFCESYDGCCVDYFITYKNGGKLPNETIQEQIMTIIDEHGIDELDEGWGYLFTEVTYELHGDLEIMIVDE